MNSNQHHLCDLEWWYIEMVEFFRENFIDLPILDDPSDETPRNVDDLIQLLLERLPSIIGKMAVLVERLRSL